MVVHFTLDQRCKTVANLPGILTNVMQLLPQLVQTLMFLCADHKFRKQTVTAMEPLQGDNRVTDNESWVTQADRKNTLQLITRATDLVANLFVRTSNQERKIGRLPISFPFQSPFYLSLRRSESDLKPYQRFAPIARIWPGLNHKIPLLNEGSR